MRSHLNPVVMLLIYVERLRNYGSHAPVNLTMSHSAILAAGYFRCPINEDSIPPSRSYLRLTAVWFGSVLAPAWAM